MLKLTDIERRRLRNQRALWIASGWGQLIMGVLLVAGGILFLLLGSGELHTVAPLSGPLIVGGLMFLAFGATFNRDKKLWLRVIDHALGTDER